MWNGSWTATLVALISAVSAQQFVMYTPVTDDTAVERMDSILNPGSISQHVHQIFGASGMSASQTYQTLQSSNCQTVADASNHGNADDKSVYWHPALYMEASNGTGYVRVPTGGHKIYYRKAGSPKDQLADPFEFPEGFRMIAGSNVQRAAASEVQSQNVTQWICHSPSGMNQGTSGGFPNGVTDCDAVDGFNGAIHFPHCWDGKPFDQANPTSHMSYPVGDVQEGECPATHPIRLPHIFVENTFNIHAVVDQVKPNTFVLSNGDPTGYSWHFDFFNGWNRGSIPALLEHCPQGTYGNEDIGTCPNFNASSVPADKCKLTSTFIEKVDLPGKLLPGCNPIQRANPAIDNAPAALDLFTDACKAVSAGSGAISSVLTSVLPTPTPTLPSTLRTVASSTKTFTPSPQHTSGGGGGGNGNVQPSPTLSSSPSPSSSSSSPSSSSSSSSTIHCPTSNNTVHTSSSGQKFLIECGIDHFAGDMGGVHELSRPWDLETCIETCAKTSGCVDVSVSGTGCYLKSSVGREVRNGVWGARLVSSGGKKRGHAREF